MPSLNQPSRDFDTWATAVRQQMLDSLAKRRVLQPDTENVTIPRQIRESDNKQAGVL